MPDLTLLSRDQPGSCWAPGLPDPQALGSPLPPTTVCMEQVLKWSQDMGGVEVAGILRPVSKASVRRFSFQSSRQDGGSLKVINERHLKEFTGKNPTWQMHPMATFITSGDADSGGYRDQRNAINAVNEANQV